MFARVRARRLSTRLLDRRASRLNFARTHEARRRRQYRQLIVVRRSYLHRRRDLGRLVRDLILAVSLIRCTLTRHDRDVIVLLFRHDHVGLTSLGRGLLSS